MTPSQDFIRARERMVAKQIAARGVRDRHVLAALRAVPRDAFVAENLRERAHDDLPLSIGEGQTISQPYIVAYMIESLGLTGGENVMEIGVGCGYAAAVLAQIAGEVHGVERIYQLAERARKTLKTLQYDNIEIRCGDGTVGWPGRAPFDAILVSAGGPNIPEALKSQLKTGGQMVIPVGPTKKSQSLIRVTRIANAKFEIEPIGNVRFVPLIGHAGWEGS